MFQRLSNSWELFKASAAVLNADKELLIFPIVSGIGALIVSATFAIPLFLTGLFDQLFVAEGGPSIVGIIVGFLFYLVQYFVIIFANSALVGAAMIRLRGGDPTVGDGFRIAFQHIGAILGYAAIAATVGMLLRALAERSNRLARIVISLIGLAWNLATYLVVPVLVVEGLGPFDALKRSVELLKKTWGEQIAGNLGLGALFGLLNFVVLIICIPLIIVGAVNESMAVIITAVIILVVALTLLGLINGALSGIYIAAVYRYAAEGQTGGFFSPEMVKNAFRQA
jgi:hypothetical protein